MKSVIVRVMVAEEMVMFWGCLHQLPPMMAVIDLQHSIEYLVLRVHTPQIVS